MSECFEIELELARLYYCRSIEIQEEGSKKSLILRFERIAFLIVGVLCFSFSAFHSLLLSPCDIEFIF